MDGPVHVWLIVSGAVAVIWTMAYGLLRDDPFILAQAVVMFLLLGGAAVLTRVGGSSRKVRARARPVRAFKVAQTAARARPPSPEAASTGATAPATEPPARPGLEPDLDVEPVPAPMLAETPAPGLLPPDPRLTASSPEPRAATGGPGAWAPPPGDGPSPVPPSPAPATGWPPPPPKLAQVLARIENYQDGVLQSTMTIPVRIRVTVAPTSR